MTLDIRREIEALPDLRVTGDEDNAGDAAAADGVAGTEPSALQVVSKQGRLILRLSASTEALDQRYAQLARQLDERDARIEQITEEQRQAGRRVRQAALAAVHLMDALDWVYQSLLQMGQETFARDVEAAQSDCLRRLATAGLAEVPCNGPLDGHLHEGVGMIPAGEAGKPPYHIVRVVRRGFLAGSDVLRRAEVVTAAPIA